MGKGKKAFKLKEYKVPQEKYVVVINAWGLPERFDNNTKLNEIGAWFQLLLSKDYPNARVLEIFYQKTHRHIIVVLPREVDITKYLGAYHYSQFHKNISPEDTRTLYIYEYRFATFGNPGNKNWNGIVPSSNSIPAGLLQVLKDPFPFPSPAPLPPPDTLYARPIPKEIQNILATVRLITNTSEDKGEGTSTRTDVSPPAPPPLPNVGSSCSFNQPSPYEPPSHYRAHVEASNVAHELPQVPAPPPAPNGSFNQPSSESLFTPYEPPSHYRAHVEASKAREDQQEHVVHELPQVKKMDPYEEEEALLRSLSPVKKDELNEAIGFLNSFLSKSENKPMMSPSTYRDDSKTISRIASTFDGEGDYKPTSELLDLFNTLPDELSSTAGKEGDYKPSSELLDLFNTLPDELSSTARKDVVVKSEIVDTVLQYGDREDVIVKSEVIETEMMPDEEYRPSDELLTAFSNLSDTTGYEGQSIKQEPKGSATARLELRVKEEPAEIQLPRRFSFHSDRKQLPRPSTSRTTMEIPRQLAPDNSRYNLNVQVKPEPVDEISSNRHLLPVPRDRQRSMFPSEEGNSQSSRDPRKRPMPSAVPIKNERNLEAEDEGSVFKKRLKMEH